MSCRSATTSTPPRSCRLGDTIEALVLTKEDKEGRLILSKKRAQYERAWGKIEEIKEAEGVVTGPVIEVVKGGLIIDIGLRGFLPATLVELRRVRDLAPLRGSRRSRPRSSSSTRTATTWSCPAGPGSRRPRRSSARTSSQNLKPGEVRRGVVSSVVNFGAFVDLGGMDGLVHVSELSWKHVDHPGSVVAVGDEIEVQVLEVDLDRERISLSLKATQQDPWQEFAGAHRVGELVYGRVTKLVPFGAFVQVGEGIEGLVHISEMSAHHVDLPEQVVTPGEELWVKIIDLDLQRRRISLSIKQAAEGGVVAAEYQEHFGEHAYDDEGNYIGPDDRGGRRRRGGAEPRSPTGPSRPSRSEDAPDEAPAAGDDAAEARRSAAEADRSRRPTPTAEAPAADDAAGRGRPPPASRGRRAADDQRRARSRPVRHCGVVRHRAVRRQSCRIPCGSDARHGRQDRTAVGTDAAHRFDEQRGWTHVSSRRWVILVAGGRCSASSPAASSTTTCRASRTTSTTRPSGSRSSRSSQTIPKGTFAEDAVANGWIVEDEIAAEFRPATAITDPSEIEGKVAIADLAANQVVVADLFVEPVGGPHHLLRACSQQNQVAITISVDQVRGVAGLLVPGDFVNMLVTDGGGALGNEAGGPSTPRATSSTTDTDVNIAPDARYLYQKVQILAIGQQRAAAAGRDRRPPTPTGRRVVQNTGLMTLTVPAEAAQWIASAPPGSST